MPHGKRCLICVVCLGVMMTWTIARAGDKRAAAADTNFWNGFLAAVQKTDPKEVELHLATLCEATHVFAALLSTNALPSIPKEAHGEFTVLPSSTNESKSFAVSYPFEVGVDITLTNAAVGTQVYILQKSAQTGTWSVVKGWRYTTNGQSIGNAALPSQAAQDAANRMAAEKMKSFHEK